MARVGDPLRQRQAALLFRCVRRQLQPLAEFRRRRRGDDLALLRGVAAG
jgi:hypothetical protein